MSALSTLARVVHVLLLGLWLGAGVFFAGVVAPSAFAALPTRQAAGELVTRILQLLDLHALAAGPILFLTLFMGYAPLGVRLRLRAVAIVLMTGLAAASRQWLTPRMVELREAMGRPIDDVSPLDPLKEQFSTLHVVSTSIFAAHVALALVALIGAVVATAPKRRGGIEL